jgi:hypothetical protein
MKTNPLRYTLPMIEVGDHLRMNGENVTVDGLILSRLIDPQPSPGERRKIAAEAREITRKFLDRRFKKK